MVKIFVLANMTLDGLEATLAEKFPRAKKTGLKMHMVRYADDFIITGNSKEWLEQEVKPAVVEFLTERGLLLSPFIKCRRVDAVFPTDLRYRNATFNPFQRFHDLAIRKFRLLHVELPQSEKILLQIPVDCWGDYPRQYCDE